MNEQNSSLKIEQRRVLIDASPHYGIAQMGGDFSVHDPHVLASATGS